MHRHCRLVSEQTSLARPGGLSGLDSDRGSDAVQYLAHLSQSHPDSALLVNSKSHQMYTKAQG